MDGSYQEPAATMAWPASLPELDFAALSLCHFLNLDQLILRSSDSMGSASPLELDSAALSLRQELERDQFILTLSDSVGAKSYGNAA